MIHSLARWTALLALAWLPAAAGAAENPLAVVRHQQGDDPRWAAPGWDDHDWQPGNVVPTRAGICWVRVHFQFSDTKRLRLLPEGPARAPTGFETDDLVDSVFMAAPVSYEFYWDGRLIGRSGVVGATHEEEVVGPLDKLHLIPEDLRGPGEHVAAIRLSSFHYNFPAREVYIGFLPSNSTGHYVSEAGRLVLPMICLGGALVVGLLSALDDGLVGRWRPLLLCSLVSFALAVFYLLVARRWSHNDPYDWLYPRLLLITWVMTAVAWLFPWLLLEQFRVPVRRWWLAGLVPLLAAAWLASPIYEFKTLWLCRVMLVVSLGLAGWAVWQRRPGARVIFCGALAALLLVRADRREFLDSTFFLTFGGLVLFVFASLGQQLRAERRRAQEASLTTARLEVELLRKNFQPHFLLNTLTALSEVVEQNPPGAVRLINDLAEEFRSLSRMSGEKLIPLADELELCRAHLRVMSLRTETTWELEAGQVDPAAPVPPALFLTLVENGFAHQRVKEAVAVFTLQQTSLAGGGSRYVFLSPGRGQADTGRTLGGTGLRYVKARLEESFPGRWSFRDGWTEQGWESVIEIPPAT